MHRTNVLDESSFKKVLDLGSWFFLQGNYSIFLFVTFSTSLQFWYSVSYTALDNYRSSSPQFLSFSSSAPLFSFWSNLFSPLSALLLSSSSSSSLFLFYCLPLLLSSSSSLLLFFLPENINSEGLEEGTRRWGFLLIPGVLGTNADLELSIVRLKGRKSDEGEKKE